MLALMACSCIEQDSREAADAPTEPARAAEQPAEPQFSGSVKIDGSSTVGPISMAVAEEFMSEYQGVRVTVGISGTGGGFKKFIAGETDISDASRPIKQKEIDDLEAAGTGFIELPVAFDGLAVLVNPENDWVDNLSVEELKAICEPDSSIDNWSQVRSGFPDQPLNLYVPGTDSGTFEYFTEAIVGEAGAHRSDCAAMSEDDNVLVTGIAGDKGALGYFGYAYYAENTDKLKLVPIAYEGNSVAPSPETINNGTYQPLSRPIFIYVSTASRGRPEVDEFVTYYLEKGAMLSSEVGYVALPDEIYELGRKHYEENVTGSMFAGGGATVGVSLEELMAKLSQ
ncbi:MAG TPA: PstS family phosphate ABC transporter substrate-binding protein [Firmicutes bacterium]|nr:PstS family phosphate ABC transporter substrate-binding protein [Bacillota bacterium]